MRVDRSGNITSITGGDAFTSLGQFVGGSGRAGDLFGPLMSIRHGNGMVAVGESWEDVDRIDNSMLGRFKMSTRHTLRSVSGRDAQLDMVGKIELDTESGSDSSFQVKESSYSGRYSWDLDLGLLRQLDSTMRLQIDSKGAGTPASTRSETVMKVTRAR